MVIVYPTVESSFTIGVTAPSSGLPPALHPVLHDAIAKMEGLGHKVICGDTNWKQDRVRSTTAKERAKELNNMLQHEEIDILMPPFGGELLIEILESIDYEAIQPKWVVGYSDISLLLFVITLKTGIATAHCTNLIDVRGEYSDDTTKKWLDVLMTKAGEEITQTSSTKYQKEWDFTNPSPCIFHLTEPTKWKLINGQSIATSGRLLGGCIDVISHVIGTPYGDVAAFQQDKLQNEPIVWYFENVEQSPCEFKRTLVQMKYAGWFTNCNAILFGRTPIQSKDNGYSIVHVYEEIAEEFQIPIAYDIDCGHLPPQITFVNGAYVEIVVEDGKGVVKQRFIS